MQLLNVQIFYPLYVVDKFGKERINSTMVSIAMCAYELAGVTCSYFHRGTIAKMGKKNAMTFAFLLEIISVAGMGALALISVD